MIKNNTAANIKTKNNLQEGIRQKADGTFNCRINVKGAEGRWKNIEMSGFKTVKEAQTARALIQAEYNKVLPKLAISSEHMTDNPVSKVSTSGQGEEEWVFKTYTQAELARLEERVSTTNLLSVFKLGRDLGVRCRECFGLLWSDIDWDKRTIKISKQLVYEDKMWCLRCLKTKASIREVQLQDSIYNYLKELKVTQEQQKAVVGIAYKETRVADCTDINKYREIVTNLDFINIKPNGELLTPDSAKVLARIASVELGYYFKYHNLRHTHVSELAINGVSILAVKARLGHTSVETTAQYYPYVSFLAGKDVIDVVDKGGRNND